MVLEANEKSPVARPVTGAAKLTATVTELEKVATGLLIVTATGSRSIAKESMCAATKELPFRSLTKPAQSE